MRENTNDRIITEAYNENREPFLYYVRKNYGLSRTIAEDIYQDTILAFHQNVLKGKVTNLNIQFKKYLFAIGKNKIVDYYRNREKKVEIETEIEKFHDVFYKEEQSDINRRETIVYEAVNQMAERCKEILLLVYWDNKSMNEIAEQMKFKTPDVAKTAKLRCMKKMEVYLTGKLKEVELL